MSKMEKIFTPPDRSFSLKLPAYWEEYDDGEENTFAFFNTKSWTGNLRITPFYWTKSNDTDTNKSAKFIQDELSENEGAIKINLGNFDCVHYKKAIEQDGENLVIYYWIIGKRNDLFICSLTIDREQELQAQNKEVLETVQNIIKSINVK